MGLTMGERLATVENEVKNVKGEVQEVKQIIKEGFEQMNKKLDTATTKLDDASIEFITKEAFDHTISELKKRTWVQNVLSAIFGSILTILIGLAAAKIIGG